MTILRLLATGVVLLALAWASAAGAAIGGEGLPLDPEAATRVFREANALYAEGRYDEAVARYDQILAGGIENADVRYNLANAYYKLGSIGRAVLNYERALRREPGHEDARANLEFLRQNLADRQTTVGGPLSDLFANAYARASPDRLAALASLFYFILVAALIVGILRGGVVGWPARLAVVMGVHLLVVGGLLGLKLYGLRSVREAIIVTREVAVRTGPNEDFVLEFRLHEGTKVLAREARDDWLRISVSGTDLEGWLPAEALEEI